MWPGAGTARGKVGRSNSHASSVRTLDAMAAQENLSQPPRKVKFRVLIIGRANAGKTSILQRVCDTTESPEIFSIDSSGDRRQVRPVPSGTFYLSPSSQIQLEGSMEVRQPYPYWRWLILTILLAAWHAQHRGRNYLHKA